MNPKKMSFQKIEHSRFMIYLKKAKDFYQSMLRAYGEGNWHSVGLEAIHCAISSTDALLVCRGGIRSTSQSHFDTADLLISQLKTEDSKKNARLLVKILEMKNLVEYEDRIFTQKEAADALRHTERYFEWVKNQLPQEF